MPVIILKTKRKIQKGKESNVENISFSTYLL